MAESAKSVDPEVGKMHRQTGEKFADPTAMSRQLREVSVL